MILVFDPNQAVDVLMTTNPNAGTKVHGFVFDGPVGDYFLMGSVLWRFAVGDVAPNIVTVRIRRNGLFFSSLPAQARVQAGPQEATYSLVCYGVTELVPGDLVDIRVFSSANPVRVLAGSGVLVLVGP